MAPGCWTPRNSSKRDLSHNIGCGGRGPRTRTALSGQSTDGAHKATRRRSKRYAPDERETSATCRRKGETLDGPDGDVFCRRCMRRNWKTLFFQPFKMKRDRFTNILLDFAFRFSRGNAARKIRAICREVSLRFLDNDKVFAHFSPACFRMLFKVPGGKSWLGWPAMVTKPGLELCLNWRWLPLVRAKYQPPSLMSLIASRTFICSVPWESQNVNAELGLLLKRRE